MVTDDSDRLSDDMARELLSSSISPHPWRVASECVAEFLAFAPVPAELIQADLSVHELLPALDNPLLSSRARSRVLELLGEAGWKESEPLAPVARRERDPLFPLRYPKLHSPTRPIPRAATPPREEFFLLPAVAYLQKRTEALTSAMGRDLARAIAAHEAIDRSSGRDAAELGQLYVTLRAWPRVADLADVWRALFRSTSLPAYLGENLFDDHVKPKTQGEQDTFVRGCLGILENPSLPAALRRRASTVFPKPTYGTSDAARRQAPSGLISWALIDRQQAGARAQSDPVFDAIIVELDSPDYRELLAMDPMVSDGALLRLVQDRKAARWVTAANPRSAVSIGLVAACNPAVTLSRLEGLLGKTEAPISLPPELVEREELSSTLIEHFARSAVDTRPTLAKRKDLSALALGALIDDLPRSHSPREVWLALIDNPSVSADALRRIWELALAAVADERSDVLCALAQRPECNQWLTEASLSESLQSVFGLGPMLLRNEALSPSLRAVVLEHVASDSKLQIAAAATPDLPTLHLDRLASGACASTRRALSTHPAGRRALLSVTSKSAHPLVRYLSSIHPDCPASAAAATGPSLPSTDANSSPRATLEVWRDTLERYSGGLTHMSESDCGFRVLALSAPPAGERLISALRQLGHIKPAASGALKGALHERLDAAIRTHKSLLSRSPPIDRARQLTLIDQFLADTSSLADRGEILLAAEPEGRPAREGSRWRNASPVALVGRAFSTWVAFVAPDPANRLHAKTRSAPIAGVEVSTEDPQLHTFLTNIASRAPDFGMNQVEQLSARYVPYTWWWALASGSSADEALEKALIGHGVLRCDVLPWDGYSGAEDDENSAAPFEKLNAELRRLNGLHRYVYGWDGTFDDILLGTTPEGDCVGIAARVVWT